MADLILILWNDYVLDPIINFFNEPSNIFLFLKIIFCTVFIISLWWIYSKSVSPEETV